MPERLCFLAHRQSLNVPGLHAMTLAITFYS